MFPYSNVNEPKEHSPKYGRFIFAHSIQGVSKRALQLWKRIEIYTENIHNILSCQNVAKHTEFYLG